MPTVLKLLGMRFFYWSREHKAIHIHVKKGDAEARFVLEFEIEMVENFGFKPHELAIAEEIIRDNREYMIEYWKILMKILVLKVLIGMKTTRRLYITMLNRTFTILYEFY